MSDLTTAEEQLFEQWAAAPLEESPAAPGIARLLQALKAVRAERDALAAKVRAVEAMHIDTSLWRSEWTWHLLDEWDYSICHGDTPWEALGVEEAQK